MNAEASNYPFCTINPNVGRVGVPDVRLEKLANIASSMEIIKSQIDFVDIAGLVRGASGGEGLGNQFLSNIRDVDCILNLVRCFDDEDIAHVEKNVNPLRDIEVIKTELILADMQNLENRLQGLRKRTKGSNDGDMSEQISLIEKILGVLDGGDLAINANLSDEDEKNFKMLQLLTGKKQFFVCNVSDLDVMIGNGYTKQVEKYCGDNNYPYSIFSAKIESEIALLENEEEKEEFLQSLGLPEKGLDKIIKISYNLLDIISFFTAGPKETHSWTIRKGLTAPRAAGVIHTDFEKGFIRAETISYSDYVDHGGEEGCRLAGKIRLEGKDYVVADGDIMHFRFNI
jgi:GTP-binding protein YchF